MQHSPPPSLGLKLADAARLLRRRFEQESRDIPMTMAQLHIVARLSRSEGIGQAALAALLDLEPMTVSRHVDRMEAAGLVERRPDPGDRRVRRLYTTERARAMLLPLRERAAAVYDQVLAGLSDEDRQRFHASLDIIISNLSAADAGADAATAGPSAAKEVA